MPNPAPLVVSCNGGDVSALRANPKSKKTLCLAYDDSAGAPANIRVGLPRFVNDVYHLSDRLLDLLEIAAYVYCADRHTSRGPKDAVEYHAWSPSLRFVIRVRDYEFWSQSQVARSREELLGFLAGYREISFTFQEGHKTPPTSLFDAESFAIANGDAAEVMLFSGGLDSLTGAVELLETTDKRLLLVSHRSGLPSTGTTQDALIKALSQRYPGRIQPFKFRCGLTGERAQEETQRTRFFLYSVTAFALAASIDKMRINVFENGVTSLNLPKRQDLMLGRASRTTHPKTISLLNRFLSLVAGSDFTVATPYFDKTKTDVLETLNHHGGRDLLDSSVSCSKTFKKGRLGTHCGGCSQCVDRRFAAFASGLEECDNGLYAHDFITQEVTEGESHAMLLNFLGQAADFAAWSIDGFYTACLSELSEIVDYLGRDEEEAIKRLYDLCARHGKQVKLAIRRMRDLYDDPFGPKQPINTVLRMIDGREYMNNSTVAAASRPPNGKQHTGISAHQREIEDNLDRKRKQEAAAVPDEKRVFVSYAHKDADWLAQFETHIKPYVRNTRFIPWTDKSLKPGEKWEEVIAREMQNADIGVLLVTPDFLASDFIFEKELPELLTKKVFWIAVRHSAYKETTLADLQCANDPAHPIAALTDAERDAAWVSIGEKLKAETTNP